MNALFRSVVAVRRRPEALLRSDGGFTLASTMMGLAIILIVSAGGVGLFSRALQSGSESKHISAATTVAKSLLEAIKTTDYSYIPVLFPEDTPTAVASSSLPSGATWTVMYPTGTGSDMMTVEVTVSWDEPDGTKSVELVTMVVET